MCKTNKHGTVRTGVFWERHYPFYTTQNDNVFLARERCQLSDSTPFILGNSEKKNKSCDFLPLAVYMYETHRHMKTQVAKCEERHQGKSGHLQRSAHNSSNVSVVSFFRQYVSASAIFCNDNPCASVAIAAKLIVLHPRLHPWHTCQLNPPGLSGSLQDTAPISSSPVRVTISPG